VDRGGAACFGCLSLPLGAFVFGYTFALLNRHFPSLADGRHALAQPIEVGFTYSVLSVVSIFVFVCLPLAIGTTLTLKAFLQREKPAGSSSGAL
jgi:hypothetical protein